MILCDNVVKKSQKKCVENFSGTKTGKPIKAKQGTGYADTLFPDLLCS